MRKNTIDSLLQNEPLIDNVESDIEVCVGVVDCDCVGGGGVVES